MKIILAILRGKPGTKLSNYFESRYFSLSDQELLVL
jgi:hypothetical protein